MITVELLPDRYSRNYGAPCGVLTSHKPSHPGLYFSNQSSWITFHHLVVTYKNSPCRTHCCIFIYLLIYLFLLFLSNRAVFCLKAPWNHSYCQPASSSSSTEAGGRKTHRFIQQKTKRRRRMHASCSHRHTSPFTHTRASLKKIILRRAAVFTGLSETFDSIDGGILWDKYSEIGEKTWNKWLYDYLAGRD